jgi:hypothetical protein
MATFRDRIEVVIDMTTTRAQQAARVFRSEWQQAEGVFGKLRASSVAAFDVIRSNAPIAAAAVAAGAVKIGAASVKAASDLGESANAVQVMFGDAGDAVLALGEDASETAGLSKRAFNEMAVSFGGFARQIRADNPAGVIEDLTLRAADFASVMNMEVAEAGAGFRQMLSGETEFAKRFGMDLSAAKVEAFALAEGLIANRSELTESIKVQARYGLIMQQTERMAGDFANTSDSLANSQRRAAARIENAAAALGAALIPVVEEATSGLLKLHDAALMVNDVLGDDTSKVLFGTQLWDLPDLFMDKVVRPLIEAQAEGIDSANRYTQAQEMVNDEIRQAAAEYQLAQMRAVTYTDAQTIQADAIERATRHQQAQNDALDRARDRFRELADAVYDVEEAEVAYGDALEAAFPVLTDSNRTHEDERRVLRAVAMEADALAQAKVREKGVTLDSVAGQREWNRQMLALAATLSGPARAEILAHTARVNGIPSERATEISALLDAGSVQAAEDILNRVARTRTTTITARTQSSAGGNRFLAGGTPGASAGAALIGEQGGPELVELPSGAKVHTAAKTRDLIGRSSAGVTHVTNVFHFPAGVDPTAAVNAQRDYERRNGPT